MWGGRGGGGEVVGGGGGGGWWCVVCLGVRGRGDYFFSPACKGAADKIRQIKRSGFV